MIEDGPTKLYWITKDGCGEIDGVKIYEVVSAGTSVFVDVLDEKGKKRSIRRRYLAVRAFYDPNAARAILEYRRTELKDEYETRIEALDQEISKLKVV